MPCHATLTETIRAVNADALAAVLGRVAVRREDNATEQHHIVIDGKTMLASKDGEGRAIHCVSAFCQALQQVVDHTASRGKGMEIPDALWLLGRIDLKDKIVTGDAIFCQKAIAEKITEGGGNYILPVKKNQKNLLDEIQTAFSEPDFPPAKWYEPANKAHVRIEQRSIYLLPAKALSAECRDTWQIIRQIVKVERLRHIKKKGKWVAEMETAWLIARVC